MKIALLTGESIVLELERINGEVQASFQIPMGQHVVPPYMFMTPFET